jgi:ABC-2 type transport system permease protein
MNKTLLVLKHEIITLVTRPSFWLGIFGIPIIGALIFGVAARANQDQNTQSVITQLLASPSTIQAEGYVDHSGVVQSIPEGAQDLLIAYPDEEAAKQALIDGKISSYYVLPADYIESGEILYTRADFNPIAASGQSAMFESIVLVNLLGGDTNLATLVYGPKVAEVSLAPEPERDQDNPLTYWLPYGVTMLFYIIILSTASLLLSSVTKEKENRVIETLMVSVTPRQMLTGKIIGLGVVGLLQMIVWVGAGQALLAASGRTFDLPAVFQLPVSFMIWGVIFFLLGYAVYASLMAGLGALVPNLREASQATIYIILPLIIPMFLINVLIEEPHGMVAVILSLFPLTAPVVMMTRLSAGGVPWWQPILAAALVASTAVLIVRSVAGMFRAQALLSGQAFSAKIFFRALLGKE